MSLNGSYDLARALRKLAFGRLQHCCVGPRFDSAHYCHALRLVDSNVPPRGNKIIVHCAPWNYFRVDSHRDHGRDVVVGIPQNCSHACPHKCAPRT